MTLSIDSMLESTWYYWEPSVDNYTFAAVIDTLHAVRKSRNLDSHLLFFSSLETVVRFTQGFTNEFEGFSVQTEFFL